MTANCCLQVATASIVSSYTPPASASVATLLGVLVLGALAFMGATLMIGVAVGCLQADRRAAPRVRAAGPPPSRKGLIFILQEAPATKLVAIKIPSGDLEMSAAQAYLPVSSLSTDLDGAQVHVART
jgi:hypothetical protein